MGIEIKMYFYSKKMNSFVYGPWKEAYERAGTWPDDAVEISDEIFHSVIKGKEEGKTVVCGDDGFPTLADAPMDWGRAAESKRCRLLNEANKITSDWRTELQLETISDADKASLIKWMAYIKALKSLDFTAIKDEAENNAIKWPVAPE